MNTIRTIRTNNNDDSCSRAKQFIGIPVMDKDGKLLDGEYSYRFEGEDEDTICRFKDGFLDGNVYDSDGKIVEVRPALEYAFGGTEYWTKGFPHGFPAVQQNFGYYEEDWKQGVIQEIRNEIEIEEMN